MHKYTILCSHYNVFMLGEQMHRNLLGINETFNSRSVYRKSFSLTTNAITYRLSTETEMKKKAELGFHIRQFYSNVSLSVLQFMDQSETMRNQVRIRICIFDYSIDFRKSGKKVSSMVLTHQHENQHQSLNLSSRCAIFMQIQHSMPIVFHFVWVQGQEYVGVHLVHNNNNTFFCETLSY